MAASKKLQLLEYYNLIYHPFSILLDAGLEQTYSFNEYGDYKLYLVFKKISNYKANNGLNFKKYFDTNLYKIESTESTDVYAVDFTLFDNDIDNYEVSIRNYNRFCFDTLSPESKFILRHNLIYHVNKNTQYACDLLKLELNNEICPPKILRFPNEVEETYYKINSILI